MSDPEAIDPDSVLDEADLLLEMIRSIVRNPSKVNVDAARGQKSTLLTITVDPSDRGHVIGKEHKTLDAITLLFSKAAFMDGGRQVIIQLEGHTPYAAQEPTVACPSCGARFNPRANNYNERNNRNNDRGPNNDRGGPNQQRSDQQQRRPYRGPAKEFRRPTGS